MELLNIWFAFWMNYNYIACPSDKQDGNFDSKLVITHSCMLTIAILTFLNSVWEFI